MIVDILGREVKVGDIVVCTNNSSAWQQIYVVTRLGSSDRIQVNGLSYLMADYTMVCTEQYIIAKGEAEAKALIEANKQFFKEEQVQKKLPSPKFLVYRFKHYKDPKVKPRYFVVSIQGASQENYKQIKEFFSTVDTSEFGQHFSRNTLNKNYKWVYSGIDKAKTMKELKALGLDRKINEEITELDPEYAIIESFE